MGNFINGFSHDRPFKVIRCLDEAGDKNEFDTALN